MSSDTVKVRTIRPHDTSEGMKSPGDEYDRTQAHADQLAAQGVVEILAAKPAPKAKPKAAE